MTIAPLSRLRRTLLGVTVTTAIMLSSGCGDEETPPDSASPDSGASAPPSSSAEPQSSASPSPTTSESTATTVEVEIAGSAVTPLAETVELGVGETLVLAISSDRIGELHVHSTPEKELNFEAGQTRIEVSFDQPGAVDIEEHESGALLFRVLVK